MTDEEINSGLALATGWTIRPVAGKSFAIDEWVSPEGVPGGCPDVFSTEGSAALEDWLYRAGWRVEMVNSDMTSTVRLRHWRTHQAARHTEDNDALAASPARRKSLALCAHAALCGKENTNAR
jgi:hypothetical protein